MRKAIILFLLLSPALAMAQSGAQLAALTAVPAKQQLPTAPPPSSPGLALPDYQLGPGDTLRVTVWTGNEYLEQNLTLAADGSLLIPFFVNKLLPVAGLTATQLRTQIQEELQKIFIKPLAQVVTVGFESKKAFLLGEVQNPGQFSVFGNTTLLEFIIQRGGFLPRSNWTEVQLMHPSGERQKANVYDILLKGDKSQNLQILPGDIIYVPSIESVSKKYFMLGEVRAPGMVQSQEDLSLLEAIARAGTLAPSANTESIFVVRQIPDGKSEVWDIPFNELYEKGDFTRNIPLKHGDIVFVPKNTRTKVADVLNVVGPILGFVRDSVILVDIARRGNR
jgi:protein involved in polysaccharide export with SLBB domain